MRKIEKRSDCPISRTLDIFGDKWTLLIMRDLSFKGYQFYNEFLDSGEGMATNVLSDRLKMLEEKGIIISKKYEKLKTRKQYGLTKTGISLVPILLEMLVWGANFDDSTVVIPEFYQRFLNDRTNLVNEVMISLEKGMNQNFC
ncbi:winged helix-turn-helix transcriptional regulator [Flavivirga algicola]|uniref:Helix-turn-helix transcriptional regulator n=1 Tax=Flavivirga algicola TaxID=2729136 RepID=A0ABX1S054_9FLAO|nr:helix-turn-helix domain-containing protein [Flavivirga algicola]NMH88263.1 helix-turn-helix transcriptional regulator [Flavivirga algicola]